MRRMYSEKQIQELVKTTQGIDIANLVDEDGHPRFIKGTPTDKEVSGVTLAYNKWSLSGTHLLVVVAGSLAQQEFAFSSIVELNDLPEWIADKLIPVASDTIEQQAVVLYGGTNQTGYFQIRKNAQGLVYITIAGITTNAAKTFRVQFDLLVD